MPYLIVTVFSVFSMCIAIYQRFWVGEGYGVAFLAGCIFMAAQMVMEHVDKRSARK